MFAETWTQLANRMAAEQVSGNTIAVVEAMAKTNLLFYGVGSRFNGYADGLSDWDFQYEPRSFADDAVFMEFVRTNRLELTEVCQATDLVWTFADGQGKNSIHVRRLEVRVAMIEDHAAVGLSRCEPGSPLADFLGAVRDGRRAEKAKRRAMQAGQSGS